SALLSNALLARGVCELAQGRHADAYDYLIRLFDRTGLAYHAAQSSWAIGDLAEAASRTGQLDAARELLAELELQAARTASRRAQIAVVHARPLLADNDAVESQVRSAISADLS